MKVKKQGQLSPRIDERAGICLDCYFNFVLLCFFFTKYFKCMWLTCVLYVVSTECFFLFSLLSKAMTSSKTRLARVCVTCCSISCWQRRAVMFWVHPVLVTLCMCHRYVRIWCAPIVIFFKKTLGLQSVEPSTNANEIITLRNKGRTIVLIYLYNKNKLRYEGRLKDVTKIRWEFPQGEILSGVIRVSRCRLVTHRKT